MSIPRLLMFSSLLAAFAVPAMAADDAVPRAVLTGNTQLLAVGTNQLPHASVLLDAQKTAITVLPPITVHVPGPKTPSTVCFSLREYKFTRVPETNALKASSESTCEDAAQFQVKDAMQEVERH